MILIICDVLKKSNIWKGHEYFHFKGLEKIFALWFDWVKFWIVVLVKDFYK